MLVTPHLKRYVSVLILLPFFIALFSFARDSDVLESLLKKLKQYYTERPQQKLYLHLDKPFYAAGENIWFKAYVMEASLHNLDSQSSVVYVELIDANKTVFKRHMLFTDGGLTLGDFQLPDTLREGNYAIRAYTNYMKNFGEDFFFLKEFPVLNPLNKQPEQPKSYAADSLALQFFPEGGNLVACGFNRVAFKALSPDGKGFDVEGTIVDESNTVITSFKSQHKGMGVVRINPVKGKKYFARIAKPYAVTRSYPLPVVKEKGYIMQVDENTKDVKLIVLTNLDKPVSGNHQINIIVQSRGLAYYALQGSLRDNAFVTLIPKAKFPDGISQITIFDSEGRPVAERLIHQNNQETLTLKVETDTTVYEKRKMVTVFADALYRNGSPATGSFSITVYDEGLVGAPQEYPLSIVNYLSLTSDLKGHIEDPGYYFKDSLIETKKNLDLLMMINGWRRFTWEDVLNDKSAKLVYHHERGIPLSGKVLKSGGKKLPAGSIVKVLTMNGSFVRVRPDSSGTFYTDSLLYYDSMDLVFQTENGKGKKQAYKFIHNGMDPPAPTTHHMSPFHSFDASKYLDQQAEEKLNQNLSNVKVLEEFTIEEKRERFSDTRMVGEGSKSRTLDAKEMNTGTFQNIYQMIQARLSGVVVSFDGTGYSLSFRGKPGIGFLVDGRVTTGDMVAMYAPADVELIELLPNSALYGGTVINIVLRKGATMSSAKYETAGVNRGKHPGFYRNREFYSPNYDVADNRHQLEDKRTTLFWDPMMMTDPNGRAAMAFFTGDVASQYRVIIEGITFDGYPGTASVVFKVK